MEDFFQTYFVDPIRYNTGYNIVNTTVFAILLIIAVFAVYKLLEKLKISIDRKFLIGVLPFVFLGGILRALQDVAEATGASRNLLLISPGIYVTLFVVTLVALLAAKGIEYMSNRKAEYYKVWFVFGVVLDIVGLSRMHVVSSFALYAIIGISLAIGIALYVVRNVVTKRKTTYLSDLLTKENTLLIYVHLFDATTTFVTLQFFPTYFEQHVLPSFFIGIFGPWVMYLLKLAVVPTVLYLFDKEMNKTEELQKRTFLKLVVLILGLGPGTRNFLRLVMQV
ncbi:MAG: DUF63 family protein [Candidatus Aenigmarchaeota archaeon]|nr:DUF63 family protein [Candidatus Aenigmarchaeota archaeon]